VASGDVTLNYASPPVLVVMGVAGSGKTTLAGVLAERLGWDLCEGDSLQPPANLAKMAAGRPLTDEDRRPWLALIRAWIHEQVASGRPGLITCSALKRSYRDVLRHPHVVFVHLSGTRRSLLARVAAREGHFMPASLLDSQLADLEPPGPDEQAVTVDIALSPPAQADAVVRALRRKPCVPSDRG
jgi:carbohydrate kinase (thermoresistant glucokinase family)